MRAQSHTAIILLGNANSVDTLPDTPFPQWFTQITTPGRRRMRAEEGYPKLREPELAHEVVVGLPEVPNWFRFVHLHRALKSK